MNCKKCGKSLDPAPARFDGEDTFVGFYPCECETLKLKNMKKSKFIDQSQYELHEGIMTVPSGESLTIPDCAMSIGEILKNFGHGIDYNELVRNGIDLGEEQDIDDDVQRPIDLTDIYERQVELSELIEEYERQVKVKPDAAGLPDDGAPKKAQAEGVKAEPVEPKPADK